MIGECFNLCTLTKCHLFLLVRQLAAEKSKTGFSCRTAATTHTQLVEILAHRGGPASADAVGLAQTDAEHQDLQQKQNAAVSAM